MPRDTVAATAAEAFPGGPALNQNALTPVAGRDLAAAFATYQRLTVRQKKRWMEILLSFEMKNRYEVFDQSQRPVLVVQEEGSGFLSLLKRIFLGPSRPFTAAVTDAAG